MSGIPQTLYFDLLERQLLAVNTGPPSRPGLYLDSLGTPLLTVSIDPSSRAGLYPDLLEILLSEQ